MNIYNTYVYMYNTCPCICQRVEGRTSVLHVFETSAYFKCGVGWGGVITYGTRCFNVLVHFPTYVMLRCLIVLSTCDLVGWGGVGWGNNVHDTLLQCSLALSYIRLATLLQCSSLAVAWRKLNLPRPQPAHGLDLLQEH